jgi:hypothetical protein
VAPALQPPLTGLPARLSHERHRPEQTTLYQVMQEELETFLAEVEAHTGASVPAFVKDECTRARIGGNWALRSANFQGRPRG